MGQGWPLAFAPLVARLAQRVRIVVLGDRDGGDGGPKGLFGVQGNADAVSKSRATDSAQSHQQTLRHAALERQALEDAEGGLL